MAGQFRFRLFVPARGPPGPGRAFEDQVSRSVCATDRRFSARGCNRLLTFRLNELFPLSGLKADQARTVPRGWFSSAFNEITNCHIMFM